MPDKHGEVYSSDAPNGDTTDKGGVYPDTGHQTQIDTKAGTHESRDGDGPWHHTDHSKDKGDPDRHTRK